MKTFRGLLTLAVAAALTTGALADDAKKDKKQRGQRRAAAGQAFRLPKGIELSEDQKGQVAELRKEYGKKIQEVTKKIGMTPDQRKAMVEARKAAMADGKKGPAAMEASLAAANLSDDQKAAWGERQELMKEIREKLHGLLTAEQKAKLPGRKAGGKKKPKKADAA